MVMVVSFTEKGKQRGWHVWEVNEDIWIEESGVPFGTCGVLIMHGISK